MGNLIKDEESSINFQKASCTLDASVKIYSNRVDDTYSSSHRILECLSRNGKMEDDDGKPQAGKAKVGSKSSSSRLNITETIERNPALLNAVKLENDYSVDPMFHKMSKAFDEGGAKGMLMNNLRMAKEGCAISFCYGTNETFIAAATATTDDAVSVADTIPTAAVVTAPTTLNASELFAGAGLPEELQLLGGELCAALNGYRTQLSISNSDIGIIDGTITLAVLSTAPTEGANDDTAGEAFDNMSVGGDDNFNDDFGVGDYGGGEDNFSVGSPGPVSTAGAPAVNILSPTKLQWNSIAASQTTTTAVAVQEGLEHLNVQQAANDYAFINGDLFISSAVNDVAAANAGGAAAAARLGANDWAGARHWKYASSLRSAAVSKVQQMEAKKKKAAEKAERAAAKDSADGDDSDGDNDDEATTAKSSRRGGAKDSKTSRISFTSSSSSSTEFAYVDEKELSLQAPGKADSTVFSTTALAKAASPEETNNLYLPADARLSVVDLTRLFISPRVVVPTAALRAYVASSSSSSSSSVLSMAASASEQDGSLLSGDKPRDVMWGVFGRQSPTNQLGRVQNTGVFDSANNDLDDDDDGFRYGDGGDDFDDAAFTAAFTNPSDAGSDTVGGMQLLQAARKVEKIDIGYAKVSKRINIQRLKKDIWSGIGDKLDTSSRSTDPNNAGENNAPSSSSSSSSSSAEGVTKAHQSFGTTTSFQELISNIAAKPRQDDVTLPFYFICLLHLANEHVSHYLVISLSRCILL